MSSAPTISLSAPELSATAKLAKVVHLTSVHRAFDVRIFHKECRSLARAGYQVTIIAPNEEDDFAEGVDIRAVPLPKRRIDRMTRTAWQVYRKAVELDADIYHFHDPELISAGLLLRVGGKKVIYDVHEDLPKDILSKLYLPLWSRRLFSWGARQVESASCGRFSALVTVTPSIAERLRKLNNRTVLVRNYPYPEEMGSSELPSWEGRGQSIAYVGGINFKRGIIEMVQAMALLPESLSATLELAGNDLSSADLPKGLDLTAEPGWARVRHHGTISRTEVVRLLAGVRAGLVIFHPFPNHTEAMPHKMFEYMAAGIPVIASNFTFWRPIIADTKCGLLVDPKDPKSIAGAIEYLLTHPKEAEEMGRRGREAVEKIYNWRTQEQELLKLYSSLT